MKKNFFVTILILILAIPEAESKGRVAANAAQNEKIATTVVQAENISNRGYFLLGNSAYMIDVDGDNVPEIIRTSMKFRTEGFSATVTHEDFEITVSDLKNEEIGKWQKTFTREFEKLMSVYLIDTDRDGNLELWVITSIRVYSWPIISSPN